MHLADVTYPVQVPPFKLPDLPTTEVYDPGKDPGEPPDPIEIPKAPGTTQTPKTDEKK